MPAATTDRRRNGERGWWVCGGVRHFFRAGEPTALCGAGAKPDRPFVVQRGAPTAKCGACDRAHVVAWLKGCGA